MLIFAGQTFPNVTALLDRGHGHATAIIKAGDIFVADIIQMVSELVPVITSPETAPMDRFETLNLASSVLRVGIGAVCESYDAGSTHPRPHVNSEPVFADRPYVSTKVIWGKGWKHAEYIIQSHDNPLETAVELAIELLSIIGSPDTPVDDLKKLGDLAASILLYGPYLRRSATDEATSVPQSDSPYNTDRKVTSYKRNGRRELNRKELRDVYFQVQPCVGGRPAFSSPEAMVAVRPEFIDASMAKTIVDQLTLEGFTLNPNAGRDWLWQKVVAGTSCQHQLCFMNYGGKDRLRAYSLDLLWDGWIDVCADEPVHFDICAQVDTALRKFPENEEIWAIRGFTVT